MHIQINIDTSNETPDVLAAFAALTAAASGQPFKAPIPDEVRERAAEPEETAPEKPKRASRAKKAEPKPEPVETEETEEEPEDDTPMALAPAKEAPAKPAPAETEEADEEPAGATLEDLRDAAKALLTAKTDGRDLLKAILDDFGAERVTSITSDNYDAALAAIKAAK